MLTVLLQGTLTAAPVRRTSSKGSTFVTVTMRAAGEDGEAVWCSVIVFDTHAVDALLELGSGDAVAIAGEASLTHWESSSGEHRVGLRVTARRVLSVHDGRRKRKAEAQKPGQWIEP